MPDKPRRLYWDACVFLSYLNGTQGRVEVIEKLYEEAEDGGVEIFTSILSQVEVAFGRAEQDQAQPDETVRAAIDAFWLPPSPVKLVEFHRLIAQDARSLVREVKFDQERPPKPADAIHLATAVRMEVDEFQTYDGKILKLAAPLPFQIMEPWTPTPRLPGDDWGKNPEP